MYMLLSIVESGGCETTAWNKSFSHNRRSGALALTNDWYLSCLVPRVALPGKLKKHLQVLDACFTKAQALPPYVIAA